MRSILRNTLVTFTLSALAVSTAAFAQTDPGMGAWKLNAEKSTFKPGPPLQGLKTSFEAAAPGVKWRSERMGPDGKVVTSSFSGAYDGKQYPVTGSPTADAVVLRRIDALTTERVNMKGGKVVTTERRVVAGDGKSYTTTVKGINANGDPIDNIMVFDRQ
jgi:hypothetical protein